MDDRVILSTMLTGLRRFAAAVTLSIAVCGCTIPGTSSGTASPSPLAPTDVAATAQPSEPGMELGAIVADDLALQPLVDIDGVEPPDPPEVGTPFVVVQRADDALLVLPPGEAGSSAAWIPAETEAGEPTVAPLVAPCPSTAPDIADLIALGGLARFCDRVVAFDGYVPWVCGIADGVSLVSGTPDWLYGFAPSLIVYAEQPADPETDAEPPASGSLWARTPPTIPIANCDPARTGRWYAFSGHFDDPAAATCRATWSDRTGPMAEPPEVGEAACRMILVIDAARPIPAP
ncbi:MAG TPA: hypothetical protein VI277_02745 [Candidatus Limnocylindria bacterium]